MLTQEKSHDLFDRIRKFSTVDEVEVHFSFIDYALTRFANNTIHQNVAELSESASIRVAFDGKTARATTNRFDDESLLRAVRSAESIAKVQEPDPDRLPMASPEEARLTDAEAKTAGPAPQRWFDQTAAITPDDRSAAVAEIVTAAKKNSLVTAGIYSSARIWGGIVNSRGLSAFHRQTSAEVSITMLAGDSSGWQKFNSRYTVVLEPSAALDLTGFMFYDFSGLAILDQRSFLNNRVGTRLFGENISIVDDVFHRLQSGVPYDGEGVARRRVSLVENGVIKNLVYARSTAKRILASEYADKVGAVATTGHGYPLPNEAGEAPVNIVFLNSGRGQTTEEMIAGTERGILITRFWYIREVDPYEKTLTGMTRDGTFLIENGKLAGGIRNFRFNQSLIEMLNSVEAMGRPVRAVGEESFDMVVPAMKVKGFNFTEVTRF